MGSDFDKLNNFVCFNDESIKSKELFNLSKSDPIDDSLFYSSMTDLDKHLVLCLYRQHEIF